MRKEIPFVSALLFLIVVSIACDMSSGSDPSLEETRVALSVQQTSLAQGQNPQVEQPPPQVDQPVQPTYTLYPTFTQEVPPPEEPPEDDQPAATVTLTPTVTQTVIQEELFQNVTTDRTEFACFVFGMESTLTITVEMSDVDRGAALFWRLHEKATDTKLAWEIVDMVRAGGNKRTYTFNANLPGGQNNFTYPIAMTASWFEFQIISNDGADRTEVFADVTFIPCP